MYSDFRSMVYLILGGLTGMMGGIGAVLADCRLLFFD